MNDKIILLGIDINKNCNRGVNALSYGHLAILFQDYTFDKVYSLFPAKKYRYETSNIIINNKEIECISIFFDWKLFIFSLFIAPFCRLFKNFKVNSLLNFLSDTTIICASNGGDSYSDIYGLKRLFLEFISILLPELMGKKVVFTPQTLGPFRSLLAKIMAFINLKLADKVYVRDSKADNFLKLIGVKFEKTRDISSFMKPQAVDVDIKPNTIGININGLMWENSYCGLENKFDNYKQLMKTLTDKLLDDGYNILFVPHTYVIDNLSANENDYSAILDLLKNYQNDERISVIDKEYTAPELKYIISQCEFFIGSRMHSNLAALTTSTPTYAYSYSYKFKGTFEMFGCEDCIDNAVDINSEDINGIIERTMSKISERNEIMEKLKTVNSDIKQIHF